MLANVTGQIREATRRDARALWAAGSALLYRGVKNPVAITVKPPPASPVHVMRFVNPCLLSKSTSVSVPFVNAR
jgi:hypothetical protein